MNTYSIAINGLGQFFVHAVFYKGSPIEEAGQFGPFNSGEEAVAYKDMLIEGDEAEAQWND